MKNFVDFNEIQEKSLSQREFFCEMERNQIIDKINTEIQRAANNGFSKTYTLIFDRDHNYIDPYEFCKDYCIEKLKENGYDVFAEKFNDKDVKIYINWGKVV